MSKSLLDAIKSKNYSVANQQVAQTLQSKLSERLAVERKSLMTEGRDRVYRYSVQMWINKGMATPAGWDVKRYGKPNDANLAKYVRMYNDSLKPGGVNSHIGQTGRCWKAEIRDGGITSGNLVASWKDAPFSVHEATEYPRYHVVVVDKYLGGFRGVYGSGPISWAVADSKSANRTVSKKYDSKDEAQKEADRLNRESISEDWSPEAREAAAEARKKAHSEIQNPNSSGQGYHPQHDKNPHHDVLTKHGYTYSHTTPVGNSTGDRWTHHHTYKKGDHNVSVNGHHYTATWEAGKSGSGHRHAGQTSTQLDNYLKNRKK